MWLMARELQGSHVGLLVPCPSSAANKNKVCFLPFHVQDALSVTWLPFLRGSARRKIQLNLTEQNLYRDSYFFFASENLREGYHFY